MINLKQILVFYILLSLNCEGQIFSDYFKSIKKAAGIKEAKVSDKIILSNSPIPEQVIDPTGEIIDPSKTIYGKFILANNLGSYKLYPENRET